MLNIDIKFVFEDEAKETRFEPSIAGMNRSTTSADLDWEPKYTIDDIINEVNRRLGMPLYIPFISIIICYLLSSRKESKYSFFQKYIVFVAAFIVLVLAEIMVRYSGQSILNLIIYYSLPPSLILLNYLNLIRIFKFENVGK